MKAAMAARRAAVRRQRMCPAQHRCISTGTEVDFKAIQAQVRARDFQQYLVGALMPSTARDSYFVMRAFNIEVASIKDAANGNYNAAQPRFAFWHDVVANAADLGSASSGDSATHGDRDAGAGAAAAHPLTQALAIVKSRHNHTLRFLDRLIDARQQEFEDSLVAGAPCFGTMLALESYADATQGSLLYLALEALGVRDDSADHAASHIGRAITMTTLLRALPHHVQSKQLYLPADVLQQAHVTRDDLATALADSLGETHDEAGTAARLRVSDAVYEVACSANDHVRRARGMADTVPDDAVPALLTAELADSYLRQLEAVQFDAFHPSLHSQGGNRLAGMLSVTRLPSALLWHTLKHTF